MVVDEKEFNEWLCKHNKEIINDYKHDLLNALEKLMAHDGLPSDIVWNNAIKMAINEVNETE